MENPKISNLEVTIVRGAIEVVGEVVAEAAGDLVAETVVVDLAKGVEAAKVVVNLKYLLGFGFLALLIVFFLIYDRTASVVDEDRRLRIVTPLPAPKMMDLPQVLCFN